MALRVLHTSDWHIGKQLHKTDFYEDMNLFFDWLLQCITEQKVDVLLMSGDLFDQANPSQQAMRSYYLFLKQLIPLNCKVILTGGNHDSPTVLNAPKELLEALDITVIGGKPEKVEDLFIPIQKNDEKLVVAAVPFLRDQDVRRSVSGENAFDKVEQLKWGLAQYFESVNAHYETYFSDFTYILMAHLFAQGAQTSESERDIQIGNQAGISSLIFGNAPHYVALGHIHKPQIVGSDRIRYSGSPIPLSFSERKDVKQVVLLEIEKGVVQQKAIQVPVFRQLVTFTGTISEIQNKLQGHKKQGILKDLIEILVQEENENTSSIIQLENLMLTPENDDYEIVKGRIEFKNKLQGSARFLHQGQNVADFSPLEMFKKRLETENLADTHELIQAFQMLLEE